MGDSTKIQWTDATWNPIRGCSRVSAGCEHCYAEGVARRFAGPGQPYEGLVRIGKDGKPKAQWNGTVRLVPEHLGDPLRWTKPRLVFVNSMSDLFHPGVPFEYIAAVFGVMASAPRHTFQVLTKRPERALEFFEWYEGTSGAGAWPFAAVIEARSVLAHAGVANVRELLARGADSEGWPLPNVWLGVSVEDQRTADERIPVLLTLPAAVRWVSYEPAIGPVSFKDVSTADPREIMLPLAGLTWRVSASGTHLSGTHAKLDWVVIGGESGLGARPFDLAWARSTIAQCREAGVPVFVKQLGARPLERAVDFRPPDPVPSDGDLLPLMSRPRPPQMEGWTRLTIPRTGESYYYRLTKLSDRKGGDMAEWPEDLRVREWPEVRP